jgi:hypothetical protein
MVDNIRRYLHTQTYNNFVTNDPSAIIDETKSDDVSIGIGNFISMTEGDIRRMMVEEFEREKSFHKLNVIIAFFLGGATFSIVVLILSLIFG